MQNLAELKLEAIMQHLRLCPSDKSPNKAYILGLMAGIDIYDIKHLSSVINDELQDEAADMLHEAIHESEDEQPLEEKDFVRTTEL